MQLRHVVPVLGLVAAATTAASAQEVAKGVTLGAWVDTKAVGTGTGDSGTSTTDFQVGGAVKVGWSISDRAEAHITVRNFGYDGDVPVNGVASAPISVAEMYGSVKATDKLTISAGKTYGPIGYYAAEPTGLLTATTALTTNYYGAWPTGVWATYTANDQFNGTLFVADGFAQNNGTNGKAVATDGTTSKTAAAVALDLVYKPIDTVTLNLEGFVDPKAGNSNADGVTGAIYQIDFNAEYKVEKITAATEWVYNVVEGNGEVLHDDNQKNIAWAAFVTYVLPTTAFPSAVTVQISQNLVGDSNGADTGRTDTKGQLAYLTNPIGDRNFGLNAEVFAQKSKPKASGANDTNSYGVGLEGLFVLP